MREELQLTLVAVLVLYAFMQVAILVNGVPDFGYMFGNVALAQRDRTQQVDPRPSDDSDITFHDFYHDE